ncbi:hypothetical protein ACQ4PT_000218 [Festuca glaucescens]
MPEESLVPSQQGEVSPPEKHQEIHVHMPADGEPKDKVLSLLVFSSQTGNWASRQFLPGRCAPRHLYDMVTAPHLRGVKIWKAAEYWQGSLYVHCWNNIIMILRNSERAYDMVQLPGKAYEDSEYEGMTYALPEKSVLVSYERGVHYVALDKFQLHVWTLRESDDGQVEWMLAHEVDLTTHNPKIQQWIEPRVLWEAAETKEAVASLFEPRNTEAIEYNEEDSQSNTTDDVDGDDDEDEDNDGDDNNDDDDYGDDDYYDDTCHSEEGEPHEDEDGGFKSEEGSLYSCDSDKDNFIDQDETVTRLGDKKYGYYRILGLHPHKDVVLLQTHSGAAAYHFRTSRMQYLGRRLVRNPHQNGHGVNAAFLYRPCYVDALPRAKLPYPVWPSYL